MTVCPVTTECVDAPLFRPTLLPGSRTGLKEVSQVMVDKLVSVPRASIRQEIGECDDLEIDAVDGCLRRWLGLGTT